MTRMAGTAESGVGVEVGDRPISFAAHQVRAGGEMGVRDDFETMIGQLVTALQFARDAAVGRHPDNEDCPENGGLIRTHPRASICDPATEGTG